MEKERTRSLTESDFYSIPGAEAVQVLTDKRYLHGRTLFAEMNRAIKGGRIGIDIQPEQIAQLKFQKISKNELAVFIEVHIERLKPMLYLLIMNLEGSIPFVARTDRSNHHDVGIAGCSRYVSMIGVINEYIMSGCVSSNRGIMYGYSSTTFHRGVHRFVKDVFERLDDPIKFFR